MRLNYISILCISLLGFVFQQCNDPALLGGDLLKQDEIDIKFVDTFKLEASTVLDTGSITYDFNLQLIPNSMPLGNFADPIFGQTEARIYAQFARYDINSGSTPNFKGATLDSIMLYLALDSLQAPYGNTVDRSDLEVYRMNQSIDIYTRYRTGYYSFEHNPTILGTLNNIFINNKLKSDVIEPTDTFTYGPHVAFKLSTEFGNSILQLDSLLFNSDSIFRAKVFGFMFKQAIENSRMATFNINSSFSKLQIIYTQGGNHLSHTFPLASSYARVPFWTHQYTSTIRESLNSESKGKELIYLQTLGGLKAKIRFPNFSLPPGAIVNKAELEFTAITLPQDNSAVFTLPDQLALYRRDTISGLDLLTSDQGGSNDFDFSLIGGAPTKKEVNGTSITTYTLNISNHIQNIIKGREKPEVYVAIAPQKIADILPVNKNLSRVVLGGPKHPLYPMRLKISFTTF